MIGIPPFPAHEKTALCLDRAVNSVGWQSIFSCFYMYPFVNRRKQYQILLPEKYIQVLLNFGGGYFGYANIYSIDKDSYFFIFNHNPVKVENLLFIADNGCGDYYALRVDNNKCSDKIVFYEHESNTVQDTDFSDILEYLVKVGLHQQ